MVKLIIWDFDDTLVNTQPIIEASMQYTINAMGLDLSIKDTWLKYEARFSEISSIHKTFGPLAVNIDKVIKTYVYFYEQCEQLIESFIGIPELLAELKNLNILMAIATAKRRSLLKHQLKNLNWESYFYPTITPDDVSLGKPNPESIYCCLNENNVKPKDAVMIGDSLHDLDMAQRANIASIAVHYGFHTYDQALSDSYKPIAHVNNVANLKKVLLSWSQT